MTEEDDRDETLPSLVPRVIVIRGEPVMLAADVAHAFEVQTREITQAIKRNPQKFTPKHAFPLTEEEREALRSQAVISGRGWMPTVLTQKGVVRLATVLNAPKALEATDQIIDLFLSIYAQLQHGQTEVTIPRPDRLVPADEDAKQVRSLRKRIVGAVEKLLDTTIDAKTKTTVGDELGEVAAGALGHLKALLKAPQLKNDQLAAETLKILEQTSDIYERRQADLKRSHAETERIVLENVRTKMELIQKFLVMVDQLEPGPLARVLPRFAEPALLLAALKPAKRTGGNDR